MQAEPTLSKCDCINPCLFNPSLKETHMNTIEQIRATLAMTIDDSAKLQFISLLVEQYRTNK